MSEWKLVPVTPTREMLVAGNVADYTASTHNTAGVIYRAMLAAAPAAPALEVCDWWQEGESDWWQTKCGNVFILNEGTPSENSMKFCCFCGKPVKEEPYAEEEDDDE